MFFGLGFLALVGAFGVVFARNVVYSALFLLLALFAVAGIYVLLLSPFLALVQIFIYGGAITIVVLFALMLTRSSDQPRLDNRQKPIALLAGLGALGTLVATVVMNKWPEAAQDPRGATFKELGQTLFNQWAVPFEIASVVLLVALIGAIVIARPGGKE